MEQVLGGTCCAVVGLALLALVAYAVHGELTDPGTEALSLTIVVFLLALSCLGLTLSVWAWRLLRGRPRRSDGGLVSLVWLTISGLWGLFGMVLVLARDPVRNLKALFALPVAFACFVLAWVRWRHVRARRRESVE